MSISTTAYSDKYRREHVKEKVSGIKKAMEKAGKDSFYDRAKNTVVGMKNKALGTIVTAGDSKVCMRCQMAQKKGTPLPPDHPNCRCQYKKRF